jgi:hypothetical protein
MAVFSGLRQRIFQYFTRRLYVTGGVTSNQSQLQDDLKHIDTNNLTYFLTGGTFANNRLQLSTGYYKLR